MMVYTVKIAQNSILMKVFLPSMLDKTEAIGIIFLHNRFPFTYIILLAKSFQANEIILAQFLNQQVIVKYTNKIKMKYLSMFTL